jgi:hypothetical protein
LSAYSLQQIVNACHAYGLSASSTADHLAAIVETVNDKDQGVTCQNPFDNKRSLVFSIRKRTKYFGLLLEIETIY